MEILYNPLILPEVSGHCTDKARLWPSPDIETHRLNASSCEPSRILLRLLDHTIGNTTSCRVIQGWDRGRYG